MKKLLTLAWALGTLAIMRTEVIAQTQTIILNTGYDQATSQLIPVGTPDTEWMVIADGTNPPPANGRPADVVGDIWSSQNPVILTEFPNSRWVSVGHIGPGPAHRPLNDLSSYEFSFTLPPGFSSPQLTMKLRADDVIFQVGIGNTFFTGGSATTPSGGFYQNNPLVFSTSNPADFHPGQNGIDVEVLNTLGESATGLIVEGKVTYSVAAGKCDLEIKKTFRQNALVSGRPATVTITLKNVGNAPCSPGPGSGTAVQDLKPPGLKFTAPPVANQPGWQCALGVPSGNASCDAPGLTMPPGYSVTFNIKATVTAPPGSSVTNCATVSNQDDTNPANNKSCVTIKVKKKIFGTPIPVDANE